MTNNDVTTLLFVQFVAYFSKSLDRIGTGDYLQLHPSAISTTSSSMPGGTGSPCLRRLFR